VIVPGETGLLCAVRDSHSLATRMIDMLALPQERRAQMGRAAQAHIAEKYTENRVISAYRAALARAID
jgi:glycosyltransferase involved in cell wall biosynthesis